MLNFFWFTRSTWICLIQFWDTHFITFFLYMLRLYPLKSRCLETEGLGNLKVLSDLVRPLCTLCLKHCEYKGLQNVTFKLFFSRSVQVKGWWVLASVWKYIGRAQYWLSEIYFLLLLGTLHWGQMNRTLLVLFFEQNVLSPVYIAALIIDSRKKCNLSTRRILGRDQRCLLTRVY